MNDFRKPAKAILHPTDFSDDSEKAFAHALAIALRNRASLTLLHVIKDREDVVLWNEYPSVRRTLLKWGYLDEGVERKDVARATGINVRKEVGVDRNVANAILDYTQLNDCDLIVMTTDSSRRLPDWIKPRASMSASQAARLPTLFVPNGVNGCVNLDDGSVTVEHVVLAVDHKPNPQPAIDRIAESVHRFGGDVVTVTLFHVGESDQFPDITTPEVDFIKWQRACISGDCPGTISNYCNEHNADFLAMITEESKGIWDTFNGNTVEQVTRKVECPVFTIPAASV